MSRQRCILYCCILYCCICWATVCETVRPMLSVSSCLSVTFVHCGQTVARIKMKHGTQVGLGPGHIVRWGPSSPSPKGAQPPIFGTYQLRPNGCMDQDVTWYGARPWPRRLCVRWRPRSILPKRMRAELPKFSAGVYCGQTAGCIKMPLGMDVDLSPGHFV